MEQGDNDIKETLALTRENNKILRSIRSRMLWASIFRFLYWVIIIGIAVGAYYYIQPYIASLLGVYQGTFSGLQKVGNIGNSLPDLKNIQSFFGNTQ